MFTMGHIVGLLIPFKKILIEVVNAYLPFKY